MATYRYKAMDAAGKNSKGIIEADSEQQAARKVRGQGLYPLSVESLGSAVSKETSVARGTVKNVGTFSFLLPKARVRVSKSVVASTIRQLSTLLNAGLPLDVCLSTMIEQGGKSAIRSVLSQIRDRIREGADLAAAFGEFPHIFSPTFITMIRAGETSGTLEIVMERLAEHAEQQIALSRKVQGTMAYPVLMLIVGISVVVFLLTFVIPKVTQIFVDLDRALPTATQMLLFVSNGLRNNWMYIVTTLALTIVFAKRYVQTEQGQTVYHTYILRVPLIGGLIRLLVVGRMCRTLGMLLKNGVSLVKALEIVRNVAGNVVLEKNIYDMNKGVQEGRSLAEFMRQSPVFSTSAVQMVAAGEKSGQLAHMLLVVADDCENQVNSKLQVLTSLMEPVMILILGGLVGFVVMAMILPIFEMSSLVG
ncbi:MAG: type II secretion system F family protein [Desulfovibrionales bacterium]|nr:type II secretion system F family protein [Desulfovibrionales bacterium]